MSDSRYDNTPTSYFEEDMRAIIDGTQFPSRPPKSKMEELLKELNDTIKQGGGGGGGTITYLDNGKVGQASPAVYVNVPLDVPMVPGMFRVTLKDNGEEETRYINWSESETFSFSGGKDLLITATTAGLTHYDGSYRDIYCDIVSVGNSNNYNDLNNKPSINGVTLSGNKTSADLGIPGAPLAGLGMGSKTTYGSLSGVIDTNVILFRTPKNGDRLTVFIGDEISNESIGLSMTIYGESYNDDYTCNIFTPGSVSDAIHRVSGICIFEVHTDSNEEIDRFDLIAMYESSVTPSPVINTVRGLSVDLSYNNATN